MPDLIFFKFSIRCLLNFVELKSKWGAVCLLAIRIVAEVEGMEREFLDPVWELEFVAGLKEREHSQIIFFLCSI